MGFLLKGIFRRSPPDHPRQERNEPSVIERSEFDHALQLIEELCDEVDRLRSAITDIHGVALKASPEAMRAAIRGKCLTVIPELESIPAVVRRRRRNA